MEMMLKLLMLLPPTRLALDWMLVESTKLVGEHLEGMMRDGVQVVLTRAQVQSQSSVHLYMSIQTVSKLEARKKYVLILYFFKYSN